MSGVSRRSWARNEAAIETVEHWNRRNMDRGFVTIPKLVDKELIKKIEDSI
ncbi:MAG: hypothetical protein HeimC2_20790 [Candidatus Heimdallarchaeota archaeon LC_2]|nr:MAG: hypothetical protein HeimC2_20790 [Candidatus Heimdallarchaeota archaeon LC_2]